VTIRIETRKLVELIGDLRHTAHPDIDAGAINGILLHTARGYHVPGEPGLGDILVGTSTLRYAGGHTHMPCYGQMTQPMLWPLQDATKCVDWFKPYAKDHPEHTLEIGYDAVTGVVHVQGERDLFDTGPKIEFTVRDVDQWPRAIWDMLATIPAWEREDTPPLPRTDIAAALLGPFATVAKAHGGIVEVYRWHQRRTLLIGIGDRYRGFLTPVVWGDDRSPQAGTGPSGEVYPATLPPVKDTKIDKNSLLEQAADLVIRMQLASPAATARALHVKPAKVGVLFEQLEVLGVLSADGLHGRDVLVGKEQLAEVIEKIRAHDGQTEPDQPALDDVGVTGD
jgi:hypothetical protein